MDLSIALKIAKDLESSPEQLDDLFGKDDEVDRLLAEHRNATVSLLDKLSCSADQNTCRNVVLNANTSKDVLLRLAPRFPMDFFKNPTFDWWLLEDPNLLFGIGQGVVKNILKRSECPESLLTWAAKKGNEQERLAVAINSNVSTDLLKQIAERGDSVAIVAQAVLMGDPSLLSGLRGTRFYHEPGMLDDIIKRPECPLIFMEWIANSGRCEEKLALAMNPNAPVALLDLIAVAGGEIADAVRLHRKVHMSQDAVDPIIFFEATVKAEILGLDPWTAKNSWTRGWIGPGQWAWLSPSNRLLVLGMEDVSLREVEWKSEYSGMVKHNRSIRPLIVEAGSAEGLPNDLPIDHFNKLARAKDWYTRYKLAECKSTPIETLALLVKDRNVQVLGALARNSSTPPNSLAALAINKSRTVREAAASSPSTPKSSLEDLAKDNDIYIRKCAAVSLFSRELFLQICSDFAVSRLIMLSEKYGNYVNAKKKLNDISNSDLVTASLLKEANMVLREPGSSLTAEIIGATTPSVHLHARSEAAWAGAHYVDNEASQLLSLCHPGAPIGALIRNFKSTNWLYRLAVACNPSCPPNLMASLKRDAHQMVSKMAVAVEMADSMKRKKLQEALTSPLGNFPRTDAALSLVTILEEDPVTIQAFTAPCPNCKGTVKEDNGNYACCGVEGAASGCGFSFNKTQSGRAFKPAEVEVLLRSHKSGLLRGFISKAGKPFNAEMVLRFDEAKKTCRVVFDFVKDKKPESVVLSAVLAADAALQPSLGACPKCSAAVHAHGTNYVCINSMVSPAQAVPSCDFKTGQVILQQAISTEQLGKLLASGRTDLLDGFISARTQKAFKAMLVWDGKAGKVGFEFGSSRN